MPLKALRLHSAIGSICAFVLWTTVAGLVRAVLNGDDHLIGMTQRHWAVAVAHALLGAALRQCGVIVPAGFDGVTIVLLDDVTLMQFVIIFTWHNNDRLVAAVRTQ